MEYASLIVTGACRKKQKQKKNREGQWTTDDQDQENMKNKVR